MTRPGSGTTHRTQRTWRLLAAAGVLWIAVSGVGRIATGSGEPQPGIPWAKRKSGFEFQSKSNQERQEDLALNPGMLWIEQGARLWASKEGRAGKSCQDCHGEPERMKSVATRYPLWDASARRMHNLDTRVQTCRIEKQQAEPLAPESEQLLALTGLIAHQSRGLAMGPSIEGAARGVFDRGRALYQKRFGQLNLSCAQCHEENWGQRLRSEVVSQGHSNGYPIYRLEWQKIGSLHRRLRSCFLSVRAEPPRHGSDDHLAIELYLAWRAKGMPIETPAVRR